MTTPPSSPRARRGASGPICAALPIPGGQSTARPDDRDRAVEQRGGTGAFTDVRLATVATSCAEVGDRMQRTFVHFGEIAPIALPVVFATGIRPKLRERRLDQGDPEAGALLARRVDAGQDDFRSPPDQPQSTSQSAVRSWPQFEPSGCWPMHSAGRPASRWISPI